MLPDPEHPGMFITCGQPDHKLTGLEVQQLNDQFQRDVVLANRAGQAYTDLTTDYLAGTANHEANYILGGAGPTTIYGLTYPSNIVAGPGDFIVAGAGATTIYSGGADDTVTGTAGKDTFFVRPLPDNSTITFTAVQDSSGNYIPAVHVVAGSVDETELVHVRGISQIGVLLGSQNNTVKLDLQGHLIPGLDGINIKCTTGNDTVMNLSAFPGNVTVQAGSGTDTVFFGGLRNLELDGGTGQSIYEVDGTNVNVQVTADGGTLMVVNGSVQSGITKDTFSRFLVQGQAGARIALGSMGNFIVPGLIVRAGDGMETVDASKVTQAVTLLGGTGDDTLTGGSGRNFFQGGTSNTTTLVKGSNAGDTVRGGGGTLCIGMIDPQHCNVPAGNAASLRITPTTSSPTAGVVDQITVTAVDAAGHPVPGYQGTVHFASNDGRAVLPGDYTFTAADNGVHTFPVTFKTVGGRSINVVQTNVSFVAGMATVNVLPAAASYFQINSSRTSPVAGSPFTVTLTALDPFGNVDTNYRGTVHFTITDPEADPLPDYTFVAADNGIHTFRTVVLRTAGSQTLTARAGGITSSTTAEFAIPTGNSQPEGITLGPDGNLWFTEYHTNKVAKINPTTGTVTEYGVNGGPWVITVGPDNNLWFTEYDANKIGKIKPDGTGFNEFNIPTPNSGPKGITVGPDNNLWFTEYNVNQIGKITTAGTVTEFSGLTGNRGATGITEGPDGNLWFTEYDLSFVGKITTAGIITQFFLHTAFNGPVGITAGPDNNLWFVDQYFPAVCRIAPTGPPSYCFLLPTFNGQPTGITKGPDGNLWFTESNSNKVEQQGRQDHPGRRLQRVHHPHVKQPAHGDHGGPGRQPLVSGIRR
jgi:streptogramin lyase